MPFSAKNLRLKRKSISVCMRSVARNFTSPPRPPSPPSGPPACTYFSRWKETQPLPPSPALTVMLTMSTNKAILYAPFSQSSALSGQRSHSGPRA